MDGRFDELLRRLYLRPQGYARVRGGVEKRIRRHRSASGISGFDEYLDRVDRDPSFRREVEILMTVSVSRFFRDRALWRDLERKVLAHLLGTNLREVHAWSAGCALGQEAYSLKMLWNRLRRGREGVPRLAILATDMNPVYLRKAQEGIYPESALGEVPSDWRRDFFLKSRSGRHFRIADSLRVGIHWRLHDITRDPPPDEGFQIIFLRNSLLTYYAPEVQESSLRSILRSLAPEGFFVIGKKEALPPSLTGLCPFAEGSGIYRKK